MRFVILSVVFWVVLTVFATVFAASAKATEVRVLNKTVWLIIVVLIPVIGALLYLAIGRPSSVAEPTQVAPDDDPEFLRRLAERLKAEDEPKDE
jgi:uncharacterized membrane protein